MKKQLLSLSLIFVFGVYTSYKTDEKTQAAADVTILDRSSVASTVAPKGQYRDGRYIGNRADAYYGKEQVAIDISDGMIAKVQVLEYPKAQQNSVRLNTDATPRLTSEVITVQSAEVDAVTGASLTSAAFVESLSFALSQASTNKLK